MQIWALWRRYRYIKYSPWIAETYFFWGKRYKIKGTYSWFTKEKKCDLTGKIAGHIAMLFKECLFSPSSFHSCQRKLTTLFCGEQYGWACTEKSCIAFEIVCMMCFVYSKTLLCGSCSLSKIWVCRWTQWQMEEITRFIYCLLNNILNCCKE